MTGPYRPVEKTILIESLKVLIVDDNLSYRRFLSRVIERIDGVEILPSAANGRIALERMKNHPVDLVFLDIHMPDMNGLETLRIIRDAHPGAGVIMMSGEYGADADMVVQALESGAVDFIPKGFLDNDINSVASLQKTLGVIFSQFQGRKNLNQAKRISSLTKFSSIGTSGSRHKGVDLPGANQEETGNPATPSVCLKDSVRPVEIDVVVIAVSTGGPIALGQVIPRLPEDLQTPVLIVQHMPAFLTYSLARSLDGKSAIHVCEASAGETLKPGTAYLAQGGKHLLVKSRPSGGGASKEFFLALGDGPPENSVRPSADVLFRSVAETFNGNTLAVIMTGMGSDGVKGVHALKERGCYCITQSAESCVVYGMPRAVVEAGLSDESVGLSAISKRVVELVKVSRKGRLP